MPIITLLTDFGTQDGYVAAVKGAILSVCPRSTLVDISHEISSFGIEDGAFVLWSSFSSFPKGTVHLAVVDPGVGGRRRAIAVRTRNYFFVAPDNGILSYVLRSEKAQEMVSLENGKFWRRPVSRTFHARDIFGPVAAHLARGLSLRKLGPAVEDPVLLDIPSPMRRGNAIQGEIIYADKFGNFITNISDQDMAGIMLARSKVEVGTHSVRGISQHYAQIPKGRWTALISSSGFLELAMNQASVRKKLGVKKGSKVRVYF